MKEPKRLQKKLECVQFIAEVSLIANCKQEEMRLALELIADLASSESGKLSGNNQVYAAS